MFPRSPVAIGLLYVAGYVLLDRVSFIHPFAPFGITPWNPHTGLSFALILIFGPRYVPWLFAAQLAADFLVRGLPLPLTAELAVVSLTGLVYGAAAATLSSPRAQFDVTLSSRGDMLRLLSAVIVSIAVVSAGYALILWMHGMLQSSELTQVAIRAFVGDLIGAMVVTPFLLIAFTRRQLQQFSWEMAALMLLVLVGPWGVLSMRQPFQFQLFYLFFLPIVWIAVRFGLPGATVGLVAMQVGLIVATEVTGQLTENVIAYQALMVVLAMTGLAVGVLVSEQERTQSQLRLHQEALNRAARAATMGEFAAAVAHEINQPLTAIGNYVRLAKLEAERTRPDLQAVATASRDAAAQVDRAGEVVNRLRDFISAGRLQTRPTSVAKLVEEALLIYQPELERRNILCTTQLERDLPPVLADSLQIEQVILNLVRNSAEALTQAGRYDGRIVIEAVRQQQAIAVSVIDNGPGLDPEIAAQPITAFSTTKRDGLGLGLSLSRSIIEAHGGHLHIEGTSSGVRASFTLPLAQDRSVNA